MASRAITIADAWARFGDLGRLSLIGGALLMPLRRRDPDASFDALTALLASAAVCKTIKPFVHSRRPNGEDNKSFPSQHAAECFAAGLALRRHLGDPLGAAAVGTATLVSMSRLFARKHRTIDVVAGIAIGAAAGIAVCAYESGSA
ncbi:MAG: phosphatase PAP2 family protein [Bacillota bacterium]